jgi:O-antigen ligase
MIGVLALLLITWVTQPTKRRKVGPVLALLMVISAVYFPLFWNKTGAGTLSQPARAVRSTISPDTRDEQSNLYREQENANLELNIRQAGPLGKGFGLPINYALPIVDVSNFDPMIKFIPHNGGLWIWMRLGLQGEIAFWVMLATGVIAACRLTRSADSQVALLGALTVSALIGYILQGWQDLGFDNIRVAIVMGCLLGCVEAASRFDKHDDSEDSRPKELVTT